MPSDRRFVKTAMTANRTAAPGLALVTPLMAGLLIVMGNPASSPAAEQSAPSHHRPAGFIRPPCQDTPSPEQQREGDYPEGMEPLPLELPNPIFCTPTPDTTLEKWVDKHGLQLDPDRFGRRRPELIGLQDSKIVSRHKPVTTSDLAPSLGSAELVTNGDKETLDGRYVQLASGPQHVTIDLGRPVRVDAVLFWHYFADFRAYRDVIVQLSNDPEFPEEKTATVFNNDHDNSTGLGKGEDHEYIETDEGQLVANYEREDGRLVMTEPLGTYRYVRLWSNGSTVNEYNHYTEVEVWGRPPETDDSQQDESAVALNHNLAPLPVDWPNPIFICGPSEHMQQLREQDLPIDFDRLGKRRPEFLAPDNAELLSRDKPVDSSDTYPYIGSVDLVTNGDKEALDGRYVALSPGKQHITIDLKRKHTLDAVLIWHNHMDGRIYHDVVVQLSNDPEFPESETITVFNNDHDNSSGFGKGDDHAYEETDQGLLVAHYKRHGDQLLMTEPLGEYRYVRCWSNGSTANEFNHYVEVEVWGRPIEGGSE